jgi:hypothetical protein
MPSEGEARQLQAEPAVAGLPLARVIVVADARPWVIALGVVLLSGSMALWPNRPIGTVRIGPVNCLWGVAPFLVASVRHSYVSRGMTTAELIDFYESSGKRYYQGTFEQRRDNSCSAFVSTWIRASSPKSR